VTPSRARPRPSMTTMAMLVCISLSLLHGCSRSESTTAGAKPPPVVDDAKAVDPGQKHDGGVASGARPGHAAAQRIDPTPRTPMAPAAIRDAKGAITASFHDDGAVVRITGAKGQEIARANVRPARVDIDRPDGTRAASVMCRVGGFRVTDGDERELLRLKGSRAAFKVASVYGDMRFERGVGKAPDGAEVRVDARDGVAEIARGGASLVVVDGASDTRALFLFALDALPLESRLAIVVFTATVDCSRPSEDDDAR
jgi:hypothetical protein